MQRPGDWITQVDDEASGSGNRNGDGDEGSVSNAQVFSDRGLSN